MGSKEESHSHRDLTVAQRPAHPDETDSLLFLLWCSISFGCWGVGAGELEVWVLKFDGRDPVLGTIWKLSGCHFVPRTR